MGVEHWPHNQFLDKALRIVLASNVLPLDARSLVQDLIADQLQDVGVQFLQRLWQFPIRTCMSVMSSLLLRSRQLFQCSLSVKKGYNWQPLLISDSHKAVLNTCNLLHTYALHYGLLTGRPFDCIRTQQDERREYDEKHLPGHPGSCCSAAPPLLHHSEQPWLS